MDSRFSDRFSNVYVDKKVEEVRALIEKWLLEEGFSVEPAMLNDTVFSLLIRNGQKRAMYVSQRNNSRDQILIEAVVEVPEDVSRQIAMFEKTRRSNFVWSLLFSLVNSGVGYSFLGKPEAIKSIDMATAIYYDGLSKDRFMEKLHLVRRAIQIVFWTLHKELGRPAPTGLEYII